MARRYAGALIELGMEEGIHEKVGEELFAFGEAFKKADLKKVFLDPSCTVEEKLSVLDRVADKMGFTSIVRNFLKLLVERKRVGEIGAISEAFKALLDEKVGRVSAEVILPYQPDEKEAAEIRKGFERITGKAVIMDVKVDPSLIGGVIGKVGSTVYDGSLKTQLENIKNSITRG